MPVPNVLIIDSPTKNISDDENPDLVQALYREIFRLASVDDGNAIQFLLIDSDLVVPAPELSGFMQRRIAAEPDAPSLILHYAGHEHPQKQEYLCVRYCIDSLRPDRLA
jgi:hypothetical protein